MRKQMDTILARYFGGCASKQDMDRLDRWLSEHEDNQLYFDELTKLYGYLGFTETKIPAPNVAFAKSKFTAYMDKDEKAVTPFKRLHASKPFYKQWMYQAAGLLLLLTFTFSVWYVGFYNRDIHLATTEKMLEHVFVDGTRVILSKNSEITFSSNYGKKDRVIRLSGEATVYVGHKGAGKLQVVTDQLTIEDIGTIFTVTAYPEHPTIQVSVKEGHVVMYTEKKEVYRVHANESCEYDKKEATFHPGIPEKPGMIASTITGLGLQATPLVQANDKPQKSRVYQFESQPLQDVVATIGFDYGVNIEIEDDYIGMQEITVHFDHEKLGTILEVIAETMNLEVKKTKDGYLLCSKL